MLPAARGGSRTHTVDGISALRTPIERELVRGAVSLMFSSRTARHTESESGVRRRLVLVFTSGARSADARQRQPAPSHFGGDRECGVTESHT